MGVHSEGECFDASEDEETVLGSRAGAEGVLEEGDFFGPRGVFGDEGPADDVGMAIDVFGCGVEDDVDAEIEGALETGGEEGVVAEGGDGFFFGEFGDGGEVEEVHEGVGGSLGPEESGIGADGIGESVEVAHVDEIDGDAEVGDDFGEEAVGTAVEVIMDEDVVALGESGEDGCFGGHASSEGEAVCTGFESGEAIFECFSGGVSGTGVVEETGLADGFKGEGGG